jgi:hypothetical protein
MQFVRPRLTTGRARRASHFHRVDVLRASLDTEAGEYRVLARADVSTTLPGTAAQSGAVGRRRTGSAFIRP